MIKPAKKTFDTTEFLATEGPGRSLQRHAAKQASFPRESPADSVFYLQSGQAKLTVVSKRGKEATVTMLAAGDFFGEESMAGAGDAAHGLGHGRYGLCGAEDRAGRDAPRPA